MIHHMNAITFFFLDKNMAKLNQEEINDPSDVQPVGRHEDGYTNL